MRSLALTAVICLLLSLLSTPRFAYAQSNSLMLPIGHTGRVYSAVYSPVTASDPMGGKFVLTTSDDKTIMLWSAEDGKLIKIYKGHNSAVNYACFSPDGTQIISGSEDASLKIWNIESGKIVLSIDDIGDEIQYLAVNPLFGKGNNSIIICCRTKGAFMRKADDPSFNLNLDTSARIKSACFSPDGKYFITTAVDNPEVRIWESNKASFVNKINVESELAITAVYSADGQSIITSSINDVVCKWDVKSGKKLMQLKERIPEVLSAAISTDGRYIATCSAGGNTKLFNAKTGEKISEWQAGDDQQTFRGVANVSFSPNGSYILTLSGYSSIKTWLTESDELISDIKNHTSVVVYTAYSPRGNTITTIHEDGSLRSWNASNGKLLSPAENRAKYTSTDYSPANTSMGSKYFAYATYDSIAYYQIRNTEAELQKLIGHHGKVNSIAFSPDGNSIVTSSNDSTAIIWKVTPRGNGEILHVLKGHTGFVVGANYSPDGKYIITCSYDRSVIIWNASTGKPEKTLTGHTRQVLTARFSADSKKIITTCWDNNNVRIWDAKDYHVIATIKDSNNVLTDASFRPPSVNDSSGSKEVLTCGPGNNVAIWNASTGRKIKELKGHTDLVTSAIYSPDGQYILTSSYDNFCKVWNAESGKLLYNFIAVGKADYLVTDEEGRFDGSANARKMMYITCGTEVVELDQFKDLAWEPGLVSKCLGNNKEPITAKNINDLNVCQFTPEVITLPFEKNMYHFRIIPRRGGLGDIELYVNNQLVKTIDTTGLSRDKGSFLYSFNASEIADRFVAGESNEVEIKANTAEGNISSRGVSIIKSTAPKPANQQKTNLYIVSIGISLYKGDALKLNYASKDAADFAKALDAAAKNLLNKEDNKEHVFLYSLNTEPGNIEWPFKNNIRRTLDTIANKATSSDIIVIFFAGHGLLPAGQKSLYLLTAEATSFDFPDSIEKQVAISTDELIDWMTAIKAGKRVIILDACNSGQAIKTFQGLVGRGEIPADQQRALDNLQDKSGTYILSASASGKPAYESGIYNQGLLTYSLLKGLKLGEGLRATQFIDVTTWFTNARSNVDVLARDIGGRQEAQILVGADDFDVGIVDNKLKNEIVLPTKKNVFGNTLLIGNIDNLDDSLNLSEIVDRELMNRNDIGKKSILAFAPSSKSLDTYYIKGRYKVVGTTLDVSYFIFKDKDKKKEFHLAIPIEEKDQLGEKIANVLETFLAGELQK